MQQWTVQRSRMPGKCPTCFQTMMSGTLPFVFKALVLSAPAHSVRQACIWSLAETRLC